ncbi:hypothetical protein TGVAND_314265 [Toxoplasma gondii VAND]|uniref:Uncharacterized protein n=1 Tax=Toxoplasma gondii VAND TaxID=933077 RepID=A0A086QBG0_TOXGO|nr:hypothetical protein TGVAND_314265 [Toxoplasma gondii VAND]
MMTEARSGEGRLSLLSHAATFRQPSRQCQSILVSEWLANKLIRRYLESFSDQTWPSVVKWTFVLGVLSLKNSGIPLHSLSVDELVDIVNQNGYSSLTPAQRLVPLQWASSAPSPSELREELHTFSPSLSCLHNPPGVSSVADTRASVGGSGRKRVTFSSFSAPSSGLRRHSTSAIARKPSSDWRTGDPAVFLPPRAAPASPLPEAPSRFSSTPETYPSWWGDSALPPRVSCPYIAAALGSRPSPCSLSSQPGETPLSRASREAGLGSSRLSSVHTPHTHGACARGPHDAACVAACSRAAAETDFSTASAFDCFSGVQTGDGPAASYCAAFPASVAPSCLAPGDRPCFCSTSVSPPGGAGVPLSNARLLSSNEKPKTLLQSSAARGSRAVPLSPPPRSRESLAFSASPRRATTSQTTLHAERKRSNAMCIKQRNLHASRPAHSPLPPIDGFQAFRPSQEARWVCTLRPSSHRHLPPRSPRSTARERERQRNFSRLHATTPFWPGGEAEGRERFAPEETQLSPPWDLEEGTPALAGRSEAARRTPPPRGTPGTRTGGAESRIAHAIEAARGAATLFRRTSQEEASPELADSPKMACSSYFEAALAAYSETPGVHTPGEAGAPCERVACSWEIDIHGRRKRGEKPDALAFSESDLRFGRGSTNARSTFSPAALPVLAHAAPSPSADSAPPRSAAGDSCADSETLSSLSLDRVAFSPSGSASRLTVADVSFASLPRQPVSCGRGDTSADLHGEGGLRDSAAPLSDSFVSSDSSFPERLVREKRDHSTAVGAEAESDAWREQETAAIKDILEMYWGDVEQIEKGGRAGDSELEDTKEGPCFVSSETASVHLDSSPGGEDTARESNRKGN